MSLEPLVFLRLQETSKDMYGELKAPESKELRHHFQHFSLNYVRKYTMSKIYSWFVITIIVVIIVDTPLMWLLHLISRGY